MPRNGGGTDEGQMDSAPTNGHSTPTPAARPGSAADARRRRQELMFYGALPVWLAGFIAIMVAVGKRKKVPPFFEHLMSSPIAISLWVNCYFVCAVVLTLAITSLLAEAAHLRRAALMSCALCLNLALSLGLVGSAAALETAALASLRDASRIALFYLTLAYCANGGSLGWGISELVLFTALTITLTAVRLPLFVEGLDVLISLQLSSGALVTALFYTYTPLVALLRAGALYACLEENTQGPGDRWFFRVVILVYTTLYLSVFASRTIAHNLGESNAILYDITVYTSVLYGVALLVLVSFLTMRHARSRDLQLAVKEAQSQREVAVAASDGRRQFLGYIFHEIRVPFGALVLGLESIAAGVSDPAVTEDISLIRSSAANMQQILNDTLDFEKLGSGKYVLHLQPTNLHDVLVKVLRTMQPMAAHDKIQLSLEEDPHLPPLIRTDRERVSQVVFNFISNGMKFCPHNGTGAVTIRAFPLMRSVAPSLTPSPGVAAERGAFSPGENDREETAVAVGGGGSPIVPRNESPLPPSAPQPQRPLEPGALSASDAPPQWFWGPLAASSSKVSNSIASAASGLANVVAAMFVRLDAVLTAAAGAAQSSVTRYCGPGRGVAAATPTTRSAAASSPLAGIPPTRPLSTTSSTGGGMRHRGGGGGRVEAAGLVAQDDHQFSSPGPSQQSSDHLPARLAAPLLKAQRAGAAVTKPVCRTGSNDRGEGSSSPSSPSQSSGPGTTLQTPEPSTPSGSGGAGGGEAPAPPTPLEISIPPAWVRIEVQDNGVGIDATQRQKLFHAFEQIDAGRLQASKGTGLGLYICHQIVKRLGGHIGVDSIPGSGSTFYAEIPYNEAAPPRRHASADAGAAEATAVGAPTADATTPQEGEEDAAAAGRGGAAGAEEEGLQQALPPLPFAPRFLVCDDDVSSRRFLAKALKRRVPGAITVEAEHGAAAVSLVAPTIPLGVPSGSGNATRTPPGSAFDALLLDHQMPVMDGPAAARILRDRGYSGVIIGVTGALMPEEVALFRRAGADSVVEKPVNVALLLRRIRSFLPRARGGTTTAGSAAGAPGTMQSSLSEGGRGQSDLVPGTAGPYRDEVGGV